MNIKRTSYILLSIFFAATGVLALMNALNIEPSIAKAQGINHYVAIAGSDGGNDCTDSNNPCATIQHAVDIADQDDIILVAAGVYTDIHTRNGVTQTLYISKTVTVRGGYTTTNWTLPPNPETNPVVLDAQGAGRVVYITGSINPKIEGLSITGGNVPGLDSKGGGLYISGSTSEISDCRIYSNTADYGGGLYIQWGDITLTGNTIQGNTAQQDGGGISMPDTVHLFDNTVRANTAGRYGGGLFVFWHGPIPGQDSIIENVVVVNNDAVDGGGLYIRGAHSTLKHGTFARNQGSSGIHVVKYDAPVYYSHGYIDLVNTILVSHTVGISVATDNTANLEATLWGDGAWANTIDWAGDGEITTGTTNIWAEPDFVDPDNGNYHITASSAAVDAGVNSEVAVDIDGDNRPAAYGYDIGADEIPGAVLDVSQQTNQQYYNLGAIITYTVQVTSKGVITADQVYISDTLPNTQRAVAITAIPSIPCTLEQTWGGTVTCGPVDIATGSTINITFTAETTPTLTFYHAIPMNNLVQARGENVGNREASLTLYLQNCRAQINDTPPEYTTLQTAVDDANPGDIINVAGLCAGVGERNGYYQTLYISKTITMRGGYTPFDWTLPPDPEANPTILDAQGFGRVIHITGDIAPTINGLWLTGGDALTRGGYDTNGGGIFIYQASPVIRACRIYDNIASYGSGIYVDGGYDGASHLVLENCFIADNNAPSWSGDIWGGGLFVHAGDATLRHNTFARNQGNALYTEGYPGGMWEPTIISHVALTNTILVSNTTGIYVSSYSTTTLEATLWGNGVWANDTDWLDYGGTDGGLITGTINIWGNPAFADPDNGNYHIIPVSDAIDAGLAAGISNDIDGDPRPVGPGYDIGADEYLCKPLTGASISGPTGGLAGTPYTFASTIVPLNATYPLTYTWTPAPQSGQGTSDGTYLWNTPGMQDITLAVENCSGIVTATHRITISDICIPITDVSISGPAAGDTGVPYTFALTVVPLDATLPITYTWSPIPQSGQGTSSATYTWNEAGQHVVTVVVENCGGTVTDTHTIDIASGEQHIYLPIVLRNQ